MFTRRPLDGALLLIMVLWETTNKTEPVLCLLFLDPYNNLSQSSICSKTNPRFLFNLVHFIQIVNLALLPAIFPKYTTDFKIFEFASTFQAAQSFYRRTITQLKAQIDLKSLSVRVSVGKLGGQIKPTRQIKSKHRHCEEGDVSLVTSCIKRVPVWQPWAVMFSKALLKAASTVFVIRR